MKYYKKYISSFNMIIRLYWQKKMIVISDKTNNDNINFDGLDYVYFIRCYLDKFKSLVYVKKIELLS